MAGEDVGRLMALSTRIHRALWAGDAHRRLSQLNAVLYEATHHARRRTLKC